MRARMLIFRSSMECDDCPQCLPTVVGSLMSHEGGPVWDVLCREYLCNVQSLAPQGCV